MNRRDFCSSVAAATTLTACSLRPAGAAGLREADRSEAVLAQRLVFDSRFPASRQVAAEFVRRGLEATAFEGDVTALWYQDLGPQWTASRLPVAGVTTARALLCLEQLARDAWMRVVFRAEHAAGDGLPCGHRVTGKAADVRRVCAALDSDDDWPTGLALALATTSADAAPRPSLRLEAGGRWGHDRRSPGLVSWIIGA